MLLIYPHTTISLCLWLQGLHDNGYSYRHTHRDPYVLYQRAVIPYHGNNIGGGMTLALMGGNVEVTVSIGSCVFEGNRAEFGGGLAIMLKGNVSNSTFVVRNSSFANNTAENAGGGLEIDVLRSEISGNIPDNSSIHLQACSFDGNEADWGGGTAFYNSRGKCSVESKSQTLVSFVGVSWKRNSAKSGAALGLWSPNDINSIGGDPGSAELSGCLFEANSVTSSPNEINGMGVVYAESVALHMEETHLVRNGGTAMVLSSTTAYMRGNVSFEGNAGLNGGAAFLLGASWITLLNNTRVLFLSNHAYETGGAIYFTLHTGQSLNDTLIQACLFQYKSDQNVHVSFVNNTAYTLQNYQSIFISATVNCYNISKVVTFDPLVPTQIESIPVKFKFGLPAREVGGVYVTTITPGLPFTIHPIAMDVLGNNVSTTALVNVIPISSEGIYNDSTKYSLKGSSVIFVKDTAFTTPFYITGPENCSSEQMLAFKTSSVQPVVAYLHLDISNCNLGFVFNPKSMRCECHTDVAGSVVCFKDSDEACIQEGYWYGTVQTHEKNATNSSSSNGEVYTSKPCFNQFCTYGCPQGQCLSKVQGESLCQLSDITDQDSQCPLNKGGVLCSSCRENYTFTFGGVKCVETSKCNGWEISVVVLLMLGYQLAFVAAILVVLKLNVHIGSGYIYCLLYYFSVINYMVANTWPSGPIRYIVDTFVAITQIDAKFLGFFDLCFSASIANNLPLQFLKYLGPLVVGLSVFLVVILARHWPRFLRLSQNASSHAICILLLMSYTSVTETSYIILSPIQFKGSSLLFVKNDPTVVYFDPRHHLPYAIVAILAEVFIAIPFVLLLFLAPFLARWVNLTRLKPILDELQSCYKDRYRWFAGYYLLCRQIVYLIGCLNLEDFKEVFFMQWFCIAVLLVHVAFCPYKEWWLNAVDTFLLLDLLFMSLLNGRSATTIFGIGSALKFQEVATYILALLPCLYFVAVIVFLFVRVIRADWFRKQGTEFLSKCCKSRRQDAEQKIPENDPVSYDSFIEEREPLLAHMSTTLSRDDCTRVN